MKSKTVKRLLASALVAAMVALTGCGGAKDSASKDSSAAEESADAKDDAAEEAAPSGDVNLSIMWWGSDARHEATSKVLDMYTEKTGVAFTPEYTGWDGFWQKLPVLAASNSMTDVLQMDAAYIHQYVDNGKLADLTDLVDLSSLLTPEEIEAYKIDGKIYGVPLSRNGQGWMYSKDDFAKYGIEEPKNGWTWEEMADWARAAKAKLPEGVYPIPDMRYGGSSTYASYQEYAQSVGNEKTLDGNQFKLDVDTYKEFNNFFAGLQAEGLCPPSDVSLGAVELDPVNDNYLNGKVLMRSISIGSVSNLAELKTGEQGLVCIPQGDGGSGWCQSTIFFAVAENSEHKQEAADFIQYFISDLEAGKVLTTVRGLPLSDEVYASFEADLSEYALYSKKLYDTITAEGVKFVPYWDDVPTAFADWSNEFKAQQEAIIMGSQDVDKAADYLVQLGEEAAANAE